VTGKKVWWVYMIQSRRPTCTGVEYGRKPDGVIYIGVTTNIERRIKQHNEGKGARYTRGRGPWTTLACHSYNSRSDALKVEARLKKLSHAQKYDVSALPDPRHPQDPNPWVP